MNAIPLFEFPAIITQTNKTKTKTNKTKKINQTNKNEMWPSEHTAALLFRASWLPPLYNMREPTVEDWVNEERWKWTKREGEEGTWDISFHRAGKWDHMFVVRKSRIPDAGDGLFAARDLEKSETLLHYKTDAWGTVGEKETEERIARLQADKNEAGRYIMQIGRHYYDLHNKRNPAGLANDAGCEHANATCNSGGRIVAKRRIASGEEIYWCYGNQYWNVWKPRKFLEVDGAMVVPDSPNSSQPPVIA